MSFDIHKARDGLHSYVELLHYSERDLPPETFINDVLYGLGLALDRGCGTDQFGGPSGFDRIRAHIDQYLEKGAHVGDWQQ